MIARGKDRFEKWKDGAWVLREGTIEGWASCSRQVVVSGGGSSGVGLGGVGSSGSGLGGMSGISMSALSNEVVGGMRAVRHRRLVAGCALVRFAGR